ncbi:MAG: hypothetical protein K2Q26_15340 [Bdellovibrionales bacterium]|nr:hypothetical protein [Bdellovibrionales bacterium]
MKNLVFVAAALAVVVSSSANASNEESGQKSVKFCVFKQTEAIKIQEASEIQVIMVVDEKYPMGLVANKVTGDQNVTFFDGGYGVLTDAGIVEAREVQVRLEIDENGVDVKSLNISNNKTMESAFRVGIQDLEKDQVGVDQLKSVNKVAQCYSGSITLAKGLEI